MTNLILTFSQNGSSQRFWKVEKDPLLGVKCELFSFHVIS